MEINRSKFLMLKLDKLGLKDLHTQIMIYIEFPLHKKKWKYVMSQLLEATSSIRHELELMCFKNSYYGTIRCHKTSMDGAYKNSYKDIYVSDTFVIWWTFTEEDTPHNFLVDDFPYHHNSVYKNHWLVFNWELRKHFIFICKKRIEEQLTIKETQIKYGNIDLLNET